MNPLRTIGRIIGAFITAFGVVFGLTPDPTLVPVEVERTDRPRRIS